VNPVTNQTFVANGTGGNVFAVQDAPVFNTKVRLDFGRLPDDTTILARPAIAGKAVNRWFPGRTRMLGVLNRVGSVRLPWQWADVTGGAYTDSLTWSYNWGTDSLVWGENFVCFAPLEDQAATTGNLGLGTPFAGNPEVYVVYRVPAYPGIEESPNDKVAMTKSGATIVRGVLVLPKMVPIFASSLLDASGRKVSDLRPGANDVRALAPGVYFIREGLGIRGEGPGKTQKVVVAR
jgi:hypothetical protein